MSPYLKDTIERVARTTIQVSAAAVLALWIQAGSWGEIDWTAMYQTALFAAGLSLLMALAGKTTGSPDDASFQGGNDA